MNVSTKIKGALRLCNKKNIELCNVLEIKTPQALNTKFTRGSFSANDLIKIADFLGCEMLFTFPNGQKIIFTMDDILDNSEENKNK